MARPRLAEYEKKRDRKKTPEPFGGKKRGKEPIFVVQRHDARRLHYDFRLERDGALASWAVPKGIPLEPGQRALAVHVEDHPLEYANVRGRDPEGRVRRRPGRDLGQRHVRARGGEARRRAHGPAARKAARRDLDARAGQARRQSQELAHPPQARGRRRAAARAAPLQADARDARCRGAARRRLAPRGEVGRLSGDRRRSRRGDDAHEPQRQRSHGAVRVRREGDLEGGQDAGLRARRRGVRPRRAGPRDLLRDAAGQGRDALRLRRLRSPGGRRAARRGSPADRAARAPAEAARPPESERAVLGVVRRRRCALPRGAGPGIRGDRLQAP